MSASVPRDKGTLFAEVCQRVLPAARTFSTSTSYYLCRLLLLLWNVTTYILWTLLREGYIFAVGVLRSQNWAVGVSQADKIVDAKDDQGPSSAEGKATERSSAAAPASETHRSSQSEGAAKPAVDTPHESNLETAASMESTEAPVVEAPMTELPAADDVPSIAESAEAPMGEADLGKPSAVYETSAADAALSTATRTEDDLVLRVLKLPCACDPAEEPGAAARGLRRAVAEARAAGHRRVRFAVQTEHDPASVAVLGGPSSVTAACKAITDHVTVDSSEERCFEQLFLVHFTMCESWDLPQDDELLDVSVGSDWIDLGPAPLADGDKSRMETEEEECENYQGSPKSPQSVLRKRLRKVLSDHEDLYVFMDDNPFALSQSGGVRVDFVGALPHAWEAAKRSVLACEAGGVYLSSRFEVLLWPHPDVQEDLREQVDTKLFSRGSSGLGFIASGVSQFEALADKVLVALSG